MESRSTRTCPDCGAVVVLPSGCITAGHESDGERIDQVARAVCGCWAFTMPDEVLDRMIDTLRVA